MTLEEYIIFQRYNIKNYDLGEKAISGPLSDEVDRESTESEKGQNLENV